MPQERATRFTSSGFFIALLLVVFSASGLMAGVVTRQVANASGPRGQTRVATPTASATATSAPTDGTPSATGTFTLKVTLSTQRAKAGQTIQVQVAARGPDGVSPVAGVRCSLVQPDSGPQLLATLPAPHLTDATGQAAWNVTVPDQTAPGAYQVAAHGDGTAYHFDAYATLTVAV